MVRMSRPNGANQPWPRRALGDARKTGVGEVQFNVDAFSVPANGQVRLLHKGQPLDEIRGFRLKEASAVQNPCDRGAIVVTA